MPPFLPRKRLRSVSPTAAPSKSNGKGKSVLSAIPRKPTLFDALDASAGSQENAEKTKNLLAKLAGSDIDDDDDDSELSSLSSFEPDFEDVPVAKRRKTQAAAASDEEDDEDIEFEDVGTHAVPVLEAPPPSGDLDLTLTKETRISLTNPHNKKQGPSKIERQIRTSTHCMHVQFLLWHNWIRNRWLCDEEVHQILIKQLGPNTLKEIERWRCDSGIAPPPVAQVDPKAKDRGKNKGKKIDERNQRDWGQPAQMHEFGSINMSHGDPIFRLMKALTAYWKKRFRITAPGLRKLGYMSLPRLDEELKSFSKDPHDPERHGERIVDIEEFRALAKICEGSRDVSAQLFCALLRGLGLEARMVVSLQPAGLGWSKNEDALEILETRTTLRPRNGGNSNFEDFPDGDEDEVFATKTNAKTKAGPKKASKFETKKTVRRTPRGTGLKEEPIDVSDSEHSVLYEDMDDDSVIDVTPTTPRREPSKFYEKDLPPNYWVEVLSPVTNTYHAVNPLNISNPVATNPEQLALFEPRGAKSEKAKQVMAYVVGFSPDGTSKDVTIRYLKRRMWPGKTKGFRMPVEKVPMYSHRGKIKQYKEYNWFNVVMRPYVRGRDKRTEVDEQEEATDLKSVKPEKKEIKEGEETLQYFKSSTEFVLERHLRREEALLPTAKHVKMFIIKGKKEEPTTEEKVYLRKDVVRCKSVETWHKEGREPKVGQQPLKRVPYRAATTNRKRELAEAEAASGEKMLQGLYSRDQTDWIIPPPIVDGIIPKNAFGNIDVYVPSMVPEGAIHIPHRRTKEICRKFAIDYAEAVTGFDFGARMAIPIITGVVIAEENYEMVMEEWERNEAERARKEDEKRIKTALGTWRKFLMGLRIVERVREEYGDDPDTNVDVLNPWINKNSKARKNAETVDEETQRRIMAQHDEDMAGGFLHEGHSEEHVPQTFFPTRHDDDDDEGGGFIVEGNEQVEPQQGGIVAYPTPISMQSNKHGVIDRSDNEIDSSTTRARSKKAAVSPGAKISSNRPTPQKSRMIKGRGKQKHLIADFKDEDHTEISREDSEEGLSLSDPPSSSGEPAPPQNPKRRATLPIKPPAIQSSRSVPKRKAARKSETALKSHYFANDDDDDE